MASTLESKPENPGRSDPDETRVATFIFQPARVGLGEECRLNLPGGRMGAGWGGDTVMAGASPYPTSTVRPGIGTGRDRRDPRGPLGGRGSGPDPSLPGHGPAGAGSNQRGNGVHREFCRKT